MYRLECFGLPHSSSSQRIAHPPQCYHTDYRSAQEAPSQTAFGLVKPRDVTRD